MDDDPEVTTAVLICTVVAFIVGVKLLTWAIEALVWVISAFLVFVQSV